MTADDRNSAARRMGRRNRRKTLSIDNGGLVLCVIYFATYVASNASTTFEPSTSPAKHIVMLGIALWSIATVPTIALFSLLLFSPLVLIYAFSGLATYALMACIFALALPTISRSIDLVVAQRRHGVVLFLLLIALLPALAAIFQLEPGALWSDQYGRDRLLLGYWHPKEAAASFALPLLLYFLIHSKDARVGAMLVLPAALWLIGSRNVSLTIYLFLGLWRYPRMTAALLAALVVGALLLVSLPGDTFELINDVSSLRLSVWGDALSDPGNQAGDDLIVGSRLAIDSFYIELLASGGPASLLAFIAWAGLVFWSLAPTRHRNTSRPLVVSILFFSAFDSGIVSTGNIMHVTLWAMAVTPLFARRRSSRPARRLVRPGVRALPAVPVSAIHPAIGHQ